MKNKNRLAGTVVYLIGPMDEVPDLGVDWRLDIKKFLWSLNIGVFDPCDKPTNIAKEDIPTRDRINELKEHQRYDEVHNIMKEIISADLHMVDLSTFTIMNIDKDIHMCGSYSEETYSALEHKPSIVHCKQGIDQIPNWIQGLCDWRLFFDNWSSIKSYIRKVAFSKDFQDPSWRFIDYDKVFGRGE